MKVIVLEQSGFGGGTTSVYKYTKETYIQMVKNEIKWAKENDRIDNEDEVEEWLEDSEDDYLEPRDISIIESDYGIHFTVCEVEKY